MQLTPTFNFKKPGYADPVDINDINDNMDIVENQLNLRAPIASPVFTGVPSAPTAALNTNTTQLATTGFVQAKVKTDVPANALFTDTNTTYTAGAGLVLTGTVFSHQTGNGYNHIPTNGAAGQILRYSAAGVAQWSNEDMTDTKYTAGANIQISGTNVISATDTIPTKTTLGIPKVENKTSAEIRAELTSPNVVAALGYTPVNPNQKGVASGYAELDTAGKVPASQLPSYVDDVLEYPALADFPATGETGKIYTATGTNIIYRWSGTAYVEISSSLALGTTSSTAYYGDKGKVAYDHTSLTNNPHGTTKAHVQLGNADNTADAVKNVLSATKLTTARKINGVDFDGSAAITIVDGTKEPANANIQAHVTSAHARADATNTVNHATNGSISVNGVAQVVYTHPTGAGNNHIPTGGTVGQILKNTASGTATWQAETISPNTTYTAGSGLALTGTVFSVMGGNGLVQDASGLTLGTPATVTNATTNSVTATSHTHALTLIKADITGLGIPAQDTIYSHPSTHPYSMITGAPSSLPANGGSADTAKHLVGEDTRASNYAPSVYMSGGARWGGYAGWQTEFKSVSTIGVTSLTGTYAYLQTHTPWSDGSGGFPIQVAYGNGIPSWRTAVSNTVWGAWAPFNDGGNAATIDGKTVGISVPSNAKFTDTTYTLSSLGGAASATSVTAGNGLTGGGTLAASRTITLGTPETITNATTNVVSATGHTHGLTLTKADITALGIPASDTNTTYIAGNGLGLSGTTFSVAAGNGLSQDTTGISMGTPGTITNSTTNSLTTTSHTHALTVTKSDVGLSNVVNSEQMPLAGGTFTGISKAQNNTSYTVPQIRNIFSGTENPSGGSHGDIYFKRK